MRFFFFGKKWMLLSLFLAITVCQQGFAQTETVTGTVKNLRDEPLEGVSVLVKNTAAVALTNALGEFSITVSPTDTLVFSYIGLSTQEVAVAGRKVIALVMAPAAGSEQLTDVVVVAYGKQKKSEVVGSVTSVRPEDLRVPVSNLTAALAGRMAGVISVQRSGEPGADNAEFYIRGIPTFGTTRGALILIDGLESSTDDMARINTDDIESFNILKDAKATSMYGSRAANGVILITTKQGKTGKARIALRTEGRVSMNTRDVELADPVTYMKLNNEAILTRNPIAPLLYSDEKIDNTIPGSGSYIFPSVDWRKELFKDYTVNKKISLNVNGGGDVANYHVGGTYSRDNGLLKVDKRNNFNNNITIDYYSLLSNVSVNVFPTTVLTVRFKGDFMDYNGPIYSGGGFYTRVIRANPVLFPAYYPKDSAHQFVRHIMFGNYDDGRYLNPYADLVRGYSERGESKMVGQLELRQDLKFITNGLTFRGNVATRRNSFFNTLRMYDPFYYGLSNYNLRQNTYQIYLINEESGSEALDFANGRLVNSTIYMEGTLQYDKKVNKSSFGAQATGYREQRLNPNATDLQQSLPYRNLGIAGRLHYGYDDRYIAEVSFGYNGSERFHESHRWGSFPSAGIAWNVSNEPFFENLKDKINNLKLRASYGLAGLDAIGDADDRFFYLSQVNPNNPGMGSVFGRDNGYSRPGISISRYADPNITWETSRDMNVAMDLSLFRKLDIVAEYYTRKRYNILIPRAATPASMGLWAVPQTNIGEGKSQGVDIDLKYNQTFGNGMFIQGFGTFTYATSKFTVFEEYDYPGAWWKTRVGQSYSQAYGYIAQSLFADDAEVANSPRQTFGEYAAGDIKYKDVNGDGMITSLDMVPIGYPTFPEIQYGLGLSVGKTKGFDLQVHFVGSGRESFWIDPEATAPFNPYYYNSTERNSGIRYTNQLLKAYSESYWSEDNRDLYALWPRLSTYPIANNYQTSTWFMRNGSFLRLKEVEVGYWLPQRWTKRISLEGVRLYVTGYNLYTWSKFNLWDIEMGGNGLRYPPQKIYAAGLLVNL